MERHLAFGTDESVALYRVIEAYLLGFGDVTQSVAKTSITFTGPRRGFAGAHPVKNRVTGYFDLMRALPSDPRVSNVSPYGRNLFVHHFRLDDAAQFDDEFRAWLSEAYQVGRGEHLLR